MTLFFIQLGQRLRGAVVAADIVFITLFFIQLGQRLRGAVVAADIVFMTLFFIQLGQRLRGAVVAAQCRTDTVLTSCCSGGGPRQPVVFRVGACFEVSLFCPPWSVILARYFSNSK